MTINMPQYCLEKIPKSMIYWKVLKTTLKTISVDCLIRCTDMVLHKTVTFSNYWVQEDKSMLITTNESTFNRGHVPRRQVGGATWTEYCITIQVIALQSPRKKTLTGTDQRWSKHRQRSHDSPASRRSTHRAPQGQSMVAFPSHMTPWPGLWQYLVS